MGNQNYGLNLAMLYPTNKLLSLPVHYPPCKEPSISSSALFCIEKENLVLSTFSAAINGPSWDHALRSLNYFYTAHIPTPAAQALHSGTQKHGFWRWILSIVLFPGIFKIGVKILSTMWSACKDLVTQPPFTSHPFSEPGGQAKKESK